MAQRYIYREREIQSEREREGRDRERDRYIEREAPPEGSAELQTALGLNEELAQRSGQRIPSLLPERVRYLAIGANHTNAFLRAVGAGCKTHDAELADASGRLHKQLFKDQPAFIEAIEHGLTWTVISYQVEVHVPGFVDFVRPSCSCTADPRQTRERATTTTTTTATATMATIAASCCSGFRKPLTWT